MASLRFSYMGWPLYPNETPKSINFYADGQWGYIVVDFLGIPEDSAAPSASEDEIERARAARANILALYGP